MAAGVPRWFAVSRCGVVVVGVLMSSKYLADQNIDVRLATENVLAEFLREIKYIATVQEKHAETERGRREAKELRRRGSKQTMDSAATDPEEAILMEDDETTADGHEGANIEADDHEWEGEGSGAWVPGQGVFVDHAAIMDIIIQHLSYPGESIGPRRSHCANDRRACPKYRDGVDIDLPGICTEHGRRLHPTYCACHLAQPCLSAVSYQLTELSFRKLTRSRHIKLAAHETNGNLYRVIQSLSLQVLQPSPPPAVSQPATAGAVPPPTASALSSTAGSPPASTSVPSALLSTGTVRKDFAITAAASADNLDAAAHKAVNDPLDISTVTSPPTHGTQKSTSSTAAPVQPSLSIGNASSLKAKPTQPIPISEPVTPVNAEFPSSAKTKSRPDSPGSHMGTHHPSPNAPMSPVADTNGDDDPFDVRETVNVLTLQFLSDHAETRIAALEWLLMLHLKAPTKVRLQFQGR